MVQKSTLLTKCSVSEAEYMTLRDRTGIQNQPDVNRNAETVCAGKLNAENATAENLNAGTMSAGKPNAENLNAGTMSAEKPNAENANT